MKIIYLVRHGDKATGNYYDAETGYQEPPLSALGVRQAKKTAGRLRKKAVSVLYHSDHKRVQQTTELLNKKIRARKIMNPALREINTGELEKVTEEEYFAQHGQAPPPYYLAEDDTTFPGGETGKQLFARVIPAFESIVFNMEEDVCAIITSSGVIRAIISHVLNINPNHRFRIGDPPECCSLSQINYYPETGRLALQLFNDISHLS